MNLDANPIFTGNLWQKSFEKIHPKNHFEAQAPSFTLDQAVPTVFTTFLAAHPAPLIEPAALTECQMQLLIHSAQPLPAKKSDCLQKKSLASKRDFQKMKCFSKIELINKKKPSKKPRRAVITSVVDTPLSSLIFPRVKLKIDLRKLKNVYSESSKPIKKSSVRWLAQEHLFMLEQIREISENVINWSIISANSYAKFNVKRSSLNMYDMFRRVWKKNLPKAYFQGKEVKVEIFKDRIFIYTLTSEQWVHFTTLFRKGTAGMVLSKSTLHKKGNQH